MRGRKRDGGELTDWKPTRSSVARPAIVRINSERDAVVGERKFGTMQWRSRRSARQPRQDPHSAPAILRLLEKDATAAERKAMMLGAKLQRRSRFFPRENGRLGGAAETLHWAGITSRPGTADESAQFHEGGIVPAGIAARQKFCGRGPEPLASGARIDRRLQVEDAREDAGDIRFDDRDRLIECERSDGICRVAADSRELLDRFQVSRKSAAMFFHDGDSGRAEISSASVVAESLPGMKDVAFGSGGEGGEVGKTLEPLIIIRDDGGYLGLLQHELRDEDGVGIGGAAPGKIAGVFAVPGEQRSAERRIRFDGENVRRLPGRSNDFLHSPAHDGSGREA
jgi:hypothetical protein